MTLTVACLILAAGGSRRLGRPKQLLPYRDGTLLDAVLDTARSCEFDQRVVTLGDAATEVRGRVDLSGFEVVENPGFGAGCSSSIAVAIPSLNASTDVLVLLLGDQPGLSRDAVRLLLAGRGNAPLAVCGYLDGRGHPFAFSREMLPQLGALHGDKAVWRLLEDRHDQVIEVPVPARRPADVNTDADYDRLLDVAGGNG